MKRTSQQTLLPWCKGPTKRVCFDVDIVTDLVTFVAECLAGIKCVARIVLDYAGVVNTFWLSKHHKIEAAGPDHLVFFDDTKRMAQVGRVRDGVIVSSFTSSTSCNNGQLPWVHSTAPSKFWIRVGGAWVEFDLKSLIWTPIDDDNIRPILMIGRGEMLVKHKPRNRVCKMNIADGTLSDTPLGFGDNISIKANAEFVVQSEQCWYDHDDEEGCVYVHSVYDQDIHHQYARIMSEQDQKIDRALCLGSHHVALLCQDDLRMVYRRVETKMSIEYKFPPLDGPRCLAADDDRLLLRHHRTLGKIFIVHYLLSDAFRIWRTNCHDAVNFGSLSGDYVCAATKHTVIVWNHTRSDADDRILSPAALFAHTHEAEITHVSIKHSSVFVRLASGALVIYPLQ